MAHHFDKPAYDGDHILFVPDICSVVKRKPVTVYKWLATGVLPAAQVGGVKGVWESDLLERIQPQKSA